MKDDVPIAFKVRTQGHYTGAKGGEVKEGGGGAGALWYYDKTFTVATHQDQWVLAPILNTVPRASNLTTMTTHNQTHIRFLSVCSGMEAASVAWKPLGFEAVGFSEIEPFPSAILAHRFPNTKNYGDLTKYNEWQLTPGSVDLLVGGTPCQSFSVAGLRKGLEDPRGNLALTFLGLVDKLRPKWVVWENVPGVLSSNGGRDLGSFLSALGQLGYGWAYRILDAQFFGVPQRRRRVFVVATSTGDCRLAAEVLSLPEGLRGYLETRTKKRKGVASDAGASAEADGPFWDGTDRTSTLTKHGAGCQQRMPDKGNFEGIITPKPIVIDRAAFNQGENAQYEPHIGESDVMDSLVARGPHAVGQPVQHCSEVAPTVTSSGPPYSRTGNERVEAEALVAGPMAFDGYNQNLSDTSQTIRADKSDGDHVGMVMQTMAVRRLTPIECERLQGFPDNWSQIPWKGKPAEQCPDGPRYKACGNSMAVPVMAWIGKRIAEVETKQNEKANLGKM